MTTAYCIYIICTANVKPCMKKKGWFTSAQSAAIVMDNVTAGNTVYSDCYPKKPKENK